jgi:Diacylglycerol acyltransferase
VFPSRIYGESIIFQFREIARYLYDARRCNVDSNELYDSHTCSFIKLLYVCGQPLGLPKIDSPSQADIDQWHAKYCAEVSRLFNQYKERVPEYKHKKLEIV